MKIAHISDLHIRNFKYRDEYRAAFEDLYEKLEALAPDIVVNTGDTVHSKLAVSPELFDDVAYHCIDICKIAPYYIILGNHDLNLKNPGRTDAISPIVRALQGKVDNELDLLTQGPRRVYCRREPTLKFKLWNFDIRGHKEFSVDQSFINIGLYHGSISGCQTDIGFVMEEGESEVSKFDAMDYVLMGDIHKRQSFRDGRMAYPGSLIQQNYGEELVKGFLLWDIRGKDDFNVDFHEVKAPGRFYTIQVPASLSLDGISVPNGSRIRAIVEGELTPSKRIALEKSIVGAFKPLEVITPDPAGAGYLVTAVEDIDELVGSRDKLMHEHLAERGVKNPEDVIKLFRQYEAAIDPDSNVRGTTWKLKKFSWDNMMNYGDGNSIDLSKLSGLVGIFAPNASGKSSIFDILLQALFDKTSKEVPRNIDLVNDNKDIGRMSVEFEASGQPYSIERSIERIHYGQRKLAETKQWGKTTLDFSSVDDSLNGTSRPETEREIRRIIGTFEDFALTSMVSQNPIFGLPGGADILNCRETDRRKILFRVLDLDVYETIANAAKDDLKELLGKFKGVDSATLLDKMKDLSDKRATAESLATLRRSEISTLERMLDDNKQLLAEMNAQEGFDLAEELNVYKASRNTAAFKLELEEKKLRGLDDQITGADELIATLSDTRPDIPPIPLDELRDSINRLRREREGVLVDISSNHMRLSAGKKSLVTLDGVPCEGKYPSCKFISEASDFLLKEHEIVAALAELTSRRSSYDSELDGLQAHYVVHTKVAEWQKALNEAEKNALLIRAERDRTAAGIEELKRSIESLDSEIASVSASISRFSIHTAQSLRDKQDALTKSIKTARSEADSALKSVGSLDTQIESVRSDISALQDIKSKSAMLEALIEMCGKSGLPYRILALVLPVINAEIAKILGGIVKFNVFLEEDPEEQTVSLFIRYGDYKSRPLSLGSGAEKFIASLAIRVALLSVTSLPKTDFLIIDEGFGKLDPEHLEALQRMFEYLREAFGTVFIVSHVDFMRDIVDHSIEITSSDGYAHVEVS